MNIPLTPEIQALIDKHLAHGCGASPESVVLRALRALQELEMHDPSPYDQPKVSEPESASVEEERRALQALAEQGLLHVGDGSKPRGVRGVHVRGVPMSETVLDARR